jgi:hypothetical protein
MPLPNHMEEPMDDNELLSALQNLQQRANSALGEATFAGTLIGPLLVLLVRQGLIEGSTMRNLIDGALLVLERRHHPLNEADRAAIDHARSRLEFQLQYYSASPPTAPSG